MILLIPVAIVAIACWWAITNATNPFPTNTHPAPVPTTGRGVPAHCSVEFCDVHPTISLHVGHESWEFCVEHGLPYLTEELKEEAS